MRFISAEEFLKQPKEVQQVLVNWWKANESETDLVCLFLHDRNEIRLNSAKIQKCNLSPISEIIPLLVEGQLRQFIEDITKDKYDILYSLKVRENVGFYKYKENETQPTYEIETHDLLQAYWKVALEVANNKM
ncbi:hypothetical protein [Clostridium diolis]|uniref:hypothetical protein n=1 Tax=Clostridium diolis TaxID=223919 RepID=UPI003AF88B49